MEINFTGHNIDITDALRQVITQKFDRIKRYLDNHIISTHIILTVENLDHIIECTLQAPGASFNATGKSDTMYKAIDVMMHKLDKQIRRHKEKLEDRKKG